MGGSVVYVDISYCTLDDVAEQTGTVVVIDVLRAFTTAPVAIAAGAGPYRLVATLDEAYAARTADPSVRLLGEVDGLTAPGFDHGNSPTELARRVSSGPAGGRTGAAGGGRGSGELARAISAFGRSGSPPDLTGVPIVHRSSAGTQGVVLASAADRVMVTSFAIAGATARAIAGDGRISFCVTGAHSGRDGEEDRACGEYIAALLEGSGLDGSAPVDPTPYTDRVASSDAAGLFGHDPDLPAEDVPFAQVVDRFTFALAVRRAEGRHLLHRVDT